MRLRTLYTAAAVALAALNMNSAARAQEGTDQDDAVEEQVFHRLQELDTKAFKYPEGVNAQDWQIAFLGTDDKPPRPERLADLFKKYSKATPKDRDLTVQWVETIADELVQRGDAQMFLLLAAHYVRYGTVTDFYSNFNGARHTFYKDLPRLGGILKKALTKLSVADRDAFKTDLATATASYLVVPKENVEGNAFSVVSNGFVTAVLGYELLTSYAYSDEAIAALHAAVDKAEFKADDLQEFYTRQSVADFERVAGQFLPGTKSPLSQFLEIGVVADRSAGDSLRNMFIDAIKTNTVVQTIFALNRVGEIAQRHRDEGRSSSLAAQTVSLAWDKAVANILTPELLKIIFTEHYVTRYAEGPTKVPRVYYAARQKYYTDADAKAMEPVFASLLKQTQKQPAAYYELTHDFRNNETFARLWAKERTALPAQYVMPHIAHLAKIYIDDKNNGTTVDSFARMSELMRADAQRDVRLQISTTGFQRTIILLARDVKVSPEKSQRLLQYVQAAMNTWTDENPGWSKHISKPFIEMLGKTLDAPQGSAASATLKTLLELRTYYTDLDEQMKLRREADRRALAKGWKPVIQRAAPQR